MVAYVAVNQSKELKNSFIKINQHNHYIYIQDKNITLTVLNKIEFCLHTWHVLLSCYRYQTYLKMFTEQ